LLLNAGRAAIDQYLLPAGPTAANAAVVADTVSQTSRLFGSGLILLHSGLPGRLQELRIQYPNVTYLLHWNSLHWYSIYLPDVTLRA